MMVVHNGERFLAAALDSVLQQTFSDFELVVVNDGSTDGTAGIIDRYAAKDSRVVVIHQEKRGVAASRNHAIDSTRCDILAWLDADDRMLPERLERQLVFMREHPEASLVCGHAYLIDVFGKRIGQSKPSVDVERGIAELNPTLFLEIVQSTVMMRKKEVLEVGHYREDLPYVEDRELWGRLVTHGKMLKCQNELLVEYRLHAASITGQRARQNKLSARTVDYNVIRRLKGEPELSDDEFRSMSQAAPLWQRINRQRTSLSNFFYNRATRCYSERMFFYFIFFVGIAISLRPIFLLRRIVNKIS